MARRKRFERFEDLSEDEQFEEGASLMFPNASSAEEIEEEMEHLASRD